MTQATVASAAYTWVLKDGIGQFGGILFASVFGKNFDEDIKKWRFLSMMATLPALHILPMNLIT